MRELLFRGKTLGGNSKWIYGAPMTYPQSPDEALENPGGHGTVVFCAPFCRSEAVDEATVGQYTGLKDQNGTQVFEGDIMKFDANGNRFNGVVSFHNGAFDLYDEMWSPYLNYAIDTGAVVIGNMHDNPELIKPLRKFR